MSDKVRSCYKPAWGLVEEEEALPGGPGEVPPGLLDLEVLKQLKLVKPSKKVSIYESLKQTICKHFV